MNKYIVSVDDYEHIGDCKNEISHIKSICSQARNFEYWEEEDYEAEADYKEEYGDEDFESIYRGYVSFEAPKKCKKVLEDNGYYL